MRRFGRLECEAIKDDKDLAISSEQRAVLGRGDGILALILVKDSLTAGK